MFFCRCNNATFNNKNYHWGMYSDCWRNNATFRFFCRKSVILFLVQQRNIQQSNCSWGPCMESRFTPLRPCLDDISSFIFLVIDNEL